MRRRQQGAHYGRWILLAVFVVLLAGAGAAGAAVTWVLRTANSAPALSSLKQKNPGSLSEVFASDAKTRLGYIQSDEARTPIGIDRIPEDLQHATVAIEDERFYDHNGVDYEGGLRAFVENIEAGEVVQGGSTLTMQLMRNLFITDPQRTFDRKVTEACMAVDYEEEHSKEDVLRLYLNSASYGTIEGRTSRARRIASTPSPASLIR